MERHFSHYDSSGLASGYSESRSADPTLAARISGALGDAQLVLNVGAGTGSYEPADCTVVAVEPSWVMIRQRPRESAPVLRAAAESLPFQDFSFDAVMALWTVHHWMDIPRACQELSRVAGRVVVVLGSTGLNDLWITSDYFPGMARVRRPEIQPEVIASILCGRVSVSPLRIPSGCIDGFCEAFWDRPEAILDEKVRSGTSTFRSLAPAELDEGLDRLAADLRSGAWDRRYGDLRSVPDWDCGLKILIAESLR